MAENHYKTGFLFFFSLVYFTILSSPVSMPSVGVDASWAEALVMIIDNNNVFGKDFIFNYGPLGYLNTTILPNKVSVFVMVLLHFITLSHYLFIIWLAFKKSEKNWKLIAFFSLCILVPWGFFADLSFTYFYFFLFWLLYAQQTQKPLGLFLAVFCALLLFYVKVNLSLIVYSLFLLTLIYFWFFKVFNLKILLIVFFILLSVTYVFSIILNVEIVSYLSASLKIIDAYQDAMAVIYVSKYELAIFLGTTLLVLLSVLLVVFLYFKTIFQDSKVFLLFLFVGITWFLNFKQAHTAISLLNLNGYFLFLPPLVALLFLFTPVQMQSSINRLFVFVFILHFLAIQIIRLKSSENYFLSFISNDVEEAFKNESKGSEFIDVLLNKTPYNYIKNTINYEYRNSLKSNLRPLPEAFLTKYKESSIDIVPTDIDVLFFNQLKYNPRPIIQSYQANSDWLMAKNGEKYLSNSAPETVLFKVESFREQNPFWVETDLTKALLRRYSIIDSIKTPTNSFLVFRRNKITKSLSYKVLDKNILSFDKEINVANSNNPVEFSTKIEYSFLGKVCRLFFQPPYLYCTVTYKNGTKENYRVIDKILKGGIILNRKVSNQSEVFTFFSNQNHKNLQVVSIRFYSKFQWGFKPNFEGVFKEIIVE